MNSNIEGHSHHISQQFNAELEDVKNHMLEMGGVIERQIADAMCSLLEGDSGLAGEVLSVEDRIDSMEVSIDEECTRIIAKRQPAASDLRLVVAIAKTIADLERIGDLGKNIARRSFQIEGNLPPKKLMRGLQHLTDVSLEQLKDGLDAYATKDIDKANAVWERDDEIDSLYTSLFRELLTYMMEDPRNITYCTHLLFCAKNLERIGDHVTNLAESISYMITGNYEMAAEEAM